MLNKSGFSTYINLLESVISAIIFTAMFGAILIQVFFRYVLKDPLVWPYELSIYSYIYIVFFGAAMATRHESHVAFGLFFQRLPEKIRLVVQVVTNLMVISVFLIIISPSLSFMELFGSVTSTALQIPMYFVLAALPVCAVLLILSLLNRIFLDLRTLIRIGGE